ncbi:hypothetical protein B0H14DRAFT_3472164 [Mycena olivaceomarginata]|nr:hypothetical protein B0H14DRAFT_3472164 [Mycena olivaceomarginata]
MSGVRHLLQLLQHNPGGTPAPRASDYIRRENPTMSDVRIVVAAFPTLPSGSSAPRPGHSTATQGAPLDVVVVDGGSVRWAGAERGARPRNMTIRLRERPVGFMFARTNVSIHTGTVAIPFHPGIAPTPRHVPTSAR